MKQGKVYLIGAGPGDAGLMTVKGLKCLQEAEVVIYDNLAGASLLNEVSPSALLIYAGKRAGRHYLKQEETNALIVRYAQEGKTVVRLKGGDPFIFGRGGEEGMALCKHGIDFEVVPGISSSYAVAAYQGIPVTHRTMASSFHVITGHEDASKPESVLDYTTLAKEEGTLVFLMGLKNLGNICTNLISNGKDPKTPAAVMASGTTARQKMAVGTLETIEALVKEQGIQTPAITLIGDVVQLHSSLDWYSKKPLAGKCVLLTATKPMADAMAKKLDALGAQPVTLSLIRTSPISDGAVDEAYGRLSSYQWIVFTSKNGVDLFFDGLMARRLDVRQLANVKFAVIGDGTAKALEAHGIFNDFMPAHYSSKDMARTWVPGLKPGDKVLLMRAREASAELDLALTAAGIYYDAVALYETLDDDRKAEELIRTLPLVDDVTFCSASAVRAFCRMAASALDVSALDAPAANVHSVSAANPAAEDTSAPAAGSVREALSLSAYLERLHIRVICIGPVTEKAALQCGLKVDKTAKTYNIDGMIDCIK